MGFGGPEATIRENLNALACVIIDMDSCLCELGKWFRRDGVMCTACRDSRGGRVAQHVVVVFLRMRVWLRKQGQEFAMGGIFARRRSNDIILVVVVT